MNGKTKSFRDLIVWKKSKGLVVKIYKITETFPKSEVYGLVSQMRRAAVAIPSNIAEGYIRGRAKEYAQFISIAFSSGAELETQLEITNDLGYITDLELTHLTMELDEIMRMLNKLLRVLRANS